LALPDHRELAATFSHSLRARLTPQEWQAMRRDNAAETDPHVCHSHDHLDANMVMDAALADHGVEIWMADGEEMREDVQVLWNDAWTYAKHTYLTEAK